STLLVRSVVSKPVRLTVTPADVPHFCNNCTHAEELSNWGYGSQIVYVPEAADEPPDDEPEDEHAVMVPATARTASAAAAALTPRRGRERKDISASLSGKSVRCGVVRCVEWCERGLRSCPAIRGRRAGDLPARLGRDQRAVRVQRWSAVPLSSHCRTCAPELVLMLLTPSIRPLLSLAILYWPLPAGISCQRWSGVPLSPQIRAVPPSEVLSLVIPSSSPLATFLIL